MEAELRDLSPGEITVEYQRRWNRSHLYTVWCGSCRWGDEGASKSALLARVREHLDMEHQGEGTVHDVTPLYIRPPRFVGS